MRMPDVYGLCLTTSASAAAAYNAGLREVLRLRTGATRHFAEAIAYDPTFALGHAALALLGQELGASVDLHARMAAATLHAARGTEREQSHVAAVAAHLRGDSQPLLRHLEAHPRDALLLSAAVPTIAFTGATEVPQEAWSLVERCRPAYGDDWWFRGLLAFIRTEQLRFDEAMDLATASLDLEPSAGHSAHARAHAHYETGDHEAGLAWMDAWVVGDGATAESLTHFAWHAALHELTLGDLDAVRRRFETQLDPRHAIGCRALVDSGSLLFRWALTPGATDVPSMDEVIAATSTTTLTRPTTPFLAMHTLVAHLAMGDVSALQEVGAAARRQRHATQREVIAPMADAFALMASGRASEAADSLCRLQPHVWRVGGSDAQREIVEEARIAALLRADRWDEAREVLDRRLDRRRSPRDSAWRQQAQAR
ncbi:pyridine nucleotide-disulfide oxidoreductase [Nocardioides sp. Kera G14]|uniref:pyridine nucleotide-disulfide oxidoreductase n=1 Tax=Nocardioides sp. Kera G14 TaxID=2884264 RepID=UPI001D11E324|nr:pyridine nucleotide-disulfide oxidoreductase [Nocardioides sp. Kera G14]UDY25102.1 pyridine nucleotide-disulfide oxidoreductase [Nocardioides sp. Kera G14]